MSTQRYKRCTHCRTVYSYYASGQGCEGRLNHDRHCPDCRKVVLDALATVPAKFANTLLPTTAVTLDQLLAWERERDARRKKDGGLFARRIRFPLFAMDGSNRTNRTGFVGGEGALKGRMFSYSYWVDPEIEGYLEVQVDEEMQRNLETGETVPWRNYR